MRVSYSEITEYRKCQQSHFYTYIEGLMPKTTDVAPTLGRILHEYLEQYYGRSADSQPDDACRSALEFINEKWTEDLRQMVWTARAADQVELADSLDGLLARVIHIAGRYHLIHGREDASQHKVIFCETKVVFPLDDGIDTSAVIDLITEDRQGLIWMWEHKSTGNIPPPTRRLKDLQTTLYAAIAEEALGIKVDGVIWNYMRTKEPTVPMLKKDGQLTKRADLDSTWETYQREIKRYSLNEADYADVRLRLRGRELTNYFPRIALPMGQSEQVLLRDFIATARGIRFLKESGTFTPVRNIAFHCDFCPYSRLCEAVILGGEDDELKARLFTIKQRKEEQSDNNTGDPQPSLASIFD